MAPRLVGWRVGALLAPFLISSPAWAQPTASFQVSATIVPGCEIGGAPLAPGQSLGAVGTLDFGEHSALTTGPVSATLFQSTALQLACTPSVALTMSLNGGLHAGVSRNLQASAGPGRLAYRLYTDAGRTQELLVNQPVSLSFSNPQAISLSIYGELQLPGNSRPDVYSDTLVVTLAW